MILFTTLFDYEVQRGNHYLFTLTGRFITTDTKEVFVSKVKRNKKFNQAPFCLPVHRTASSSSAIDTSYIGPFHTGFVNVKSASA
jgi:hypothetical protein